MKQGLVEIVVVIDRSGSMQSLQDEVIGGFNRFLAEQKAQPGEATLTLVQFDDQYEVVHAGVPLQNVQPLDWTTYVPRGMTALTDAFGKTIDKTGVRLAALPAAERPAKVIFLVMTDGQENASQEYTFEQVKQKVQHQTDKYKWEFVFIGANIDSFAVGGLYGLNLNNVANNRASKGGIIGTYAVAGQKMTRARQAVMNAAIGGQSVPVASWESFTADEKAEMDKE